MSTSVAESGRMKELVGKYLTFSLEPEIYGLEILKIQEIIGMTELTQLPKAPEYLAGIMNLRGKIIPIVDLRVKFGFPNRNYTETSCIIIVTVQLPQGKIAVGVIVDTVLDVRALGENHIQSSPNYGSSIDTSFILGMAKVAEQVILLINIDQVLSDSEEVIQLALSDF
jgi:purine-binding chemotaxis protein CheW